MKLLSFVLAWLAEPSTYAGLGALLAASGVHIDGIILRAVIQLLVASAGLAAVLLPEKTAAHQRRSCFRLDQKPD
jgi:hypothetical protein